MQTVRTIHSRVQATKKNLIVTIFLLFRFAKILQTDVYFVSIRSSN